MREYFVALLKDLKNLTGSNQYLEIASIPEKKEAENALNDLIRPLINTSNTFNYIPDEDKKRIIRRKILEDTKFYGLTAAKVYQYLLSASDKYFTESHHLEANGIERVELTPEQEANIDKLAEEYKRKLAGAAMAQTITGVTMEIERIKREDKERVEGKKASGYVPKYNAEDVTMKERIKAARVELYGLNYVDTSKWDFFNVEDQSIFCASIEDAREIYLKASE